MTVDKTAMGGLFRMEYGPRLRGRLVFHQGSDRRDHAGISAEIAELTGTRTNAVASRHHSGSNVDRANDNCMDLSWCGAYSSSVARRQILY